VIVVSELDPTRRDIAGAFADHTAAPGELHDMVMELTHGSGVGLSVDAVGLDATRRESVGILSSGGTALWLGMDEHTATIPGFDVVAREKRVQGSFAYTDPEFAQALGLLESGLMQPGVSTKLFALRDSGNAFRQMLDNSAAGFLKAIVSPSAGVPFSGAA
jgi:threonine dehydrogenase-like Zn-dependent dehydrogenase